MRTTLNCLRSVAAILTALVMAVFIAVPPLRVHAQATSSSGTQCPANLVENGDCVCGQGVSDLDCAALQGPWTQWVPDDGSCNGVTGDISSNSVTPDTSLPIEQKIAKLLIVGFDAGDTAGMTSIVTKYKIGGLFFHGHNNGGLTKSFFDSLNAAAGFNLLVTSDDEGGQITRFDPTAPSAATMGTWDDAKIQAQGNQVGQTLASLGVNTALAPVLDLNQPGSIWSNEQRDWSADPDVVAEKAGAWAQGLASAGVNPVYKHFPGLGHINVDTDLHQAPAQPLSSFQNDLKPFQKLAGQNNGALMLGNMFVTDWNGGTVPVSISSDAVQYVRTTLNYSGIIMTDDLAAPYIDGGNLPDAIAKAIEAGVDMPLFTGGDATVQAAINAVKALPDADAKVNAALQRLTIFHSGATTSTATSCCANAGSTTLSGDNNAARVFNYFTSKGLSPAQAAGVVGNMILESGINPQRLQGTALNTVTLASQAAGSSSGWGIVQWTPAGKMITPLQNAHRDPNDLAVQLDYLWNELSTSEKAALSAVQATSTPEAAAQAFETKYERPADPAGSLNLRQTYAKAIFANSTGTPLPPAVAGAIYNGAGNTSSPGANTTSQPSVQSCGAAPGSLTGYNDPFRDLKNSHSMRIDGGLDYGGDGNGSGPVYAVGNATVTYVKVANSGWPGLGTGRSGAYISYTLSDGAAKGLSIYIAEDCTPRVKVGDSVNSNTVVCDYKDQGTHLETGWGDGKGNYVSWSDYPGAANGFASNSGQDISKFLGKMGVAPGTTGKDGKSSTPPPANWPKW